MIRARVVALSIVHVRFSWIIIFPTYNCRSIKKRFFYFRRNMMVLRVHGDDLMFGGSGGVITHAPRIPQMEMMKVHIPFTFKLHESFKSTYAGKSLYTLRLYSAINSLAESGGCWYAAPFHGESKRIFSRFRKILPCTRFILFFFLKYSEKLTSSVTRTFERWNINVHIVPITLNILNSCSWAICKSQYGKKNFATAIAY